MSNEQTAATPRKSHLVAGVTVIMIVVAAVLAVLSYVQVKDVENGTVEAVAVQQDGYLELVLEQIALNQDSTDEEIIQNILATLDGNKGSYWTFSKGQTMLFVKDVTETSRYRSLTADSYFSTQSGAEFLAGLSTEHVTHSVIDINGTQYVASGALFEYGGEQCRLCLLTNREVLLDSNAMLGARSRLLVLMLCMLAIMVAVPIGAAVNATRARNKFYAAQAQLEEREEALQKAERRHSLLDSFQVEERVWRADMLPKFEERARERGLSCAQVNVECRSQEARAKLLAYLGMHTDKRVLMFENGPDTVTLLMVNGSREELEDTLRRALTQGVREELQGQQ